MESFPSNCTASFNPPHKQHSHYSNKTSSTGDNKNSQLYCQLKLMSQYHYTVSISIHNSWERKQSEPTPQI